MTSKSVSNKKAPTPKAKPAPKPRQVKEVEVTVRESMPTRLTELEVGQSESVSRLVKSEDAIQSHLIEVGNKLADSMRSAVTRAKRRTGFTYQVNIGRFPTRDNDDYCVCVVTTRTS